MTAESVLQRDVHGRRRARRLAGECPVSRLIGATATAEQRPTATLDDKLRAAGEDVVTAAERLRILGEQAGLTVREVPASLRLCDQLGVVLLLYPTCQTVEFRLEPRLQAASRRRGACASNCS